MNKSVIVAMAAVSTKHYTHTTVGMVDYRPILYNQLVRGGVIGYFHGYKHQFASEML